MASLNAAVTPIKPVDIQRHDNGISPLDLPVDVFDQNLDRRHGNRLTLLKLLKTCLIEGSDYGSIPTKRGPSKPSLFKSGAEKICGLLGVTVRFPNLQSYDPVHSTQELTCVVIRCELLNPEQQVVAEGVGARNLKQDFGDLNKSLKMAGKSAQIDATLRLAGLSEVFSQDLEDLDDSPPDPPKPAVIPTITSAQTDNLIFQIQKQQLDPQRVLAYAQKMASVKGFDCPSLTALPVPLYDYLLGKLPELARRQPPAGPTTTTHT